MITRAHVEVALWSVLLLSVLVWVFDTCVRG